MACPQACSGAPWVAASGSVFGHCGEPAAFGVTCRVGRGKAESVSSAFSPLTSRADSVHTLTCAIMLLNTDLHGQVSEWGAPMGPGLGRAGPEEQA